MGRRLVRFGWWALVAAGCTGAVSDGPSDASAGELDARVDGVAAPEAGLSGDAYAGPSASDAGRDGGAADSGPARADAGSRPGSCAGSAFALCEDFEAAAAGALPAGWTLLPAWGGGSDPVVVDDQPHTGVQALRTGLAPNGQTRIARSLASLGALARTHWGRVYFKAAEPLALPSQGAVIHNTLVALRGQDESRVVDTVIAPDGSHQFLYNVPDDSVGIGTSYLYHAYDGAWHCAEWYVDADSQRYRFFFDGAEATFTQNPDQTPKLETFTSIALGFINYQTPSKPYDGYFDDLALDGERVGCE